MAKAKVKKITEKPNRITTTVEAFTAALKNTVVEKKVSIPILSYARVINASIVGTTLDVFTIVPFEGKGTGDFMIPYKQTLDVLNGEHGKLVMEFSDTIKNVEKGVAAEGRRFVKMSVNGIEFEFDTIAITNFPAIPEQAKPTLTVDGKTMKAMIDRTRISLTTEMSRYTVNATKLMVIKGLVIMVATDGYRMSYVTGHGEGKIENSLVIPAATNWVRNNCKGDVEIGMDDNTHTIRTTTGTIVARKNNGNFPNYDAVMPRDNKIVAHFESPKAFNAVLTRVAKCSDPRSCAIKLAIGMSAATIFASSSERGSAKAEVKCVTSGFPKPGLELVAGFNSEYISEFLKVIDEGEFTFALKNSESSGLFEVENFKYIIMPMRI